MRLAGLTSGRGFVLRHLHRRAPGGAAVEVIVSTAADAEVLDWAAAQGIATEVVPPAADPDRSAGGGIRAAIDRHDIDLVCLDADTGGLAADAIDGLPPILKCHYSLLPAFPGSDPVGDAQAAGVAVTGCTITHVADAAELGNGPEHGRIVSQEPVPVRDADREDLAARLREAGAFRAYPRAIKQFIDGSNGPAPERDRPVDADRASGSFPAWQVTSADRVAELRYGENPHQAAALYVDSSTTEPTVIDADQLNPAAKALSYNNYNDADAALALIREFERPAAAVIKHTNPAGCAVADTVAEAYDRALRTDEMSAFGGIVALNRRCDGPTAERVAESYKEVILAPGYTDAARAVLTDRDDLRVLDIGESIGATEGGQSRVEQAIDGGRLVQERDQQRLAVDDLEIATETAPSKGQRETMAFAWPVVKHVRSNAIVLATGTETVGIGMGQVSRVDAVRLAVRKAEEHAAEKGPAGAVMASDAFFPFPDAIDVAADAGIEAVVQPGGSVNDEAVREACAEREIAMAFTGRRAFRHG